MEDKRFLKKRVYINKLEEDKTCLPKANSKEEMKKFCTDFAIYVFAQADKQDRDGKADKNTAKTYYAAGTFFEILKQFSPDKELEKDIKDKALYSKWKATDIVKAIKEGRKPTAGPPAEDVNEDGESQVPRAQSSLDQWAGMIEATGGAINPAKSYWYLLVFEWTKTHWAYRNIEDMPGELMINCGAERITLQRLEPDVAKKTLGVMMAADGKVKAQVDYLKENSAAFSTNL